jgi:hypothetical protein
MKTRSPEYLSIPDVIETLDAYALDGRPPGDFLIAVLSNDLKEAFGRADTNNAENMHAVLRYCYNHIPAACWGSPEKVKAWLDFKRQQREMQQVAERK